MGERAADGETEVRAVEVGGRVIKLRVPSRPERLLDAIDAAAFRDDEKMPYWAELWPAGRAFAAQLVRRGTGVRDKDVLELGCGLGLVGIAAALAGAREVTFSDYFREALDFAADNARRNGVASFWTLELDWRKPFLPRRYEVILGADLLYERRNLDALLGAIRAALAPGGVAYIADPDRLTADEFAARAEAAGFDVKREPLQGLRGTVYVLEARRAADSHG